MDRGQAQVARSCRDSSDGLEIIEEGRTAEVFEAPRTEFTRMLIDSIPLPEFREGWLD
jgi:ABC-type dipeptide/oligopeptide/nickel transport system ATPase component